MAIKFVLMVNKQGQTRLSTYYEWLAMPERGALEVTTGSGAALSATVYLHTALLPPDWTASTCVERRRRETRRVDSRVAASTASRRRGLMKTPSTRTHRRRVRTVAS